MHLLALVGMCQCFAFWGLANLLVLFLIQHHGFEDAKAYHFFGFFTGAALALPVLGGFIADRWNYRQPVVWGCIMTAVGCFMVATGRIELLIPALALVALAAGIFIPSIYTLLGRAYKGDRDRRDSGFTIYFAAINLGIFSALFFLGALGSSHHWGAAYVIAGCVQLIGLIPLYMALKIPALQVAHREKYSDKNQPTLTKIDKQRITVILVLSLFSILFWISYNQGGSSLTLFALRYTDRDVGGFTIPPSWLLSFRNLYLIILAFPLAILYLYLARRKLDPSPPAKTALSLLAMPICFGVLAFASRFIPADAAGASISPLYLVFSYFLMALGELLLEPIGLSLITHLSPPRFTAMLVGVWYLCMGAAFYLGGVIAVWMSETMPIARFFTIFAAASAIPALILLLLAKKLDRMRYEKD